MAYLAVPVITRQVGGGNTAKRTMKDKREGGKDDNEGRATPPLTAALIWTLGTLSISRRCAFLMLSLTPTYSRSVALAYFSRD